MAGEAVSPPNELSWAVVHARTTGDVLMKPRRPNSLAALTGFVAVGVPLGANDRPPILADVSTPRVSGDAARNHPGTSDALRLRTFAFVLRARVFRITYIRIIGIISRVHVRV